MAPLYFQDLLEHLVEEDFHFSEIDFCNLEVTIGTHKKEVLTKADARKMLDSVMSALHWYDFISIMDFLDLDHYNYYVLNVYEDNLLNRYEVTLSDYDFTIFIDWDID